MAAFFRLFLMIALITVNITLGTSKSIENLTSTYAPYPIAELTTTKPPIIIPTESTTPPSTTWYYYIVDTLKRTECPETYLKDSHGICRERV